MKYVKTVPNNTSCFYMGDIQSHLLELAQREAVQVAQGLFRHTLVAHPAHSQEFG